MELMNDKAFEEYKKEVINSLNEHREKECAFLLLSFFENKDVKMFNIEMLGSHRTPKSDVDMDAMIIAYTLLCSPKLKNSVLSHLKILEKLKGKI